MAAQQGRTFGAFDCVIFGGTGDLAMRKLFPALYQQHAIGLPEPTRILACSRTPQEGERFRATVLENLRRFVAARELDEAKLKSFAARLSYFALDATAPVTSAAAQKAWQPLAAALAEHAGDAGDGAGVGDAAAAAGRARVFYMATAPKLFGPIAANIAAQKLATPEARIVLEKPIGTNLASAQRINDEIAAVFPESAIYRIDHYLGKETVQNLMALRFANSLFEPLWRQGAVDHVQITVSETVGVGGRGATYDASGALRDMVQNHLLQLLCLTAMEPPVTFDADSVRDEKLKVLRALRPITAATAARHTVRGQYRKGAALGEPVGGYGEEPDVAPESRTETFCALKAHVDNWRWAGVPFYLRTGKRLPERVSEIVIRFRPVAHSIFAARAGRLEPNQLVIRLQPDEGMNLDLMTKEPGPGGMRLKRASLDLSFAEQFPTRTPEAYERLLLDVVRGNQTLFMRRDEVEAAWRWVEPILEFWRDEDRPPPGYTAGTWGPPAATALLERRRPKLGRRRLMSGARSVGGVRGASEGVAQNLNGVERNVSGARSVSEGGAQHVSAAQHSRANGAYKFFEHAGRDAWTRALVAALRAELDAAIARNGRAVMVAAGGTTPAPVYEQLATLALDFRRVLLLPSDERCVPSAKSELRNDALLAHHFKKTNATVLPLCDATGNPATRDDDEPTARDNKPAPADDIARSALAKCAKRVARARPFDVALLGMGADGHTLSWFPGAHGLSTALADSVPARDGDGGASRADGVTARTDGVTAPATGAASRDATRAPAAATPAMLALMDAGASAVAAPCPRRVTLTRAALAGTRHVLLAVTGAEKRRVLERALAPHATVSAATLPVRALLHGGWPLEIHWSA